MITVPVKGSNVFIMDMQDSSTNGLPCDKLPQGYPLCIFNICVTEKKLKRLVKNQLKIYNITKYNQLILIQIKYIFHNMQKNISFTGVTNILAEESEK